MSALDKVRILSRDRGLRVRELKSKGVRVVGYPCLLAPVEMLTAAGLVPFRLTGSLEPAAEADAFLERLMCPFVRSCFHLARTGRFEFLDGMVWPHSCDNIQKTYDIWKHYVPHEFFHYLDVPHMTDASSLEFFTGELRSLREALEKTTGRALSEESLKAAIRAHNENRSLLRMVSALRKSDPPLLRGTEMLEILLAATALPVEEANEMLLAVLAEVESRPDRPESRAVRLLLHGSQVDNPALIELLEDCGAHVVADDLCVGSKSFVEDVEPEGDLLGNLARRYLNGITCPRTFRTLPGTHAEDCERRFGYLREWVRDYRVNGAVLYILMFCDCFEFDAPDVRDYLERLGIPVLHLEDDYSLSGIKGLKSRIEAFLEMVGRPREEGSRGQSEPWLP